MAIFDDDDDDVYASGMDGTHVAPMGDTARPVWKIYSKSGEQVRAMSIACQLKG